jgi:hypothetical protein
LVHRSAAADACYAQRDNDNGIGIVSQNFEPDFDAYDSRGADDFSLDSACSILEVDTDGEYFNGSGPADSFHVTFYRNNLHNKPGRRVSNQNLLSYTDEGLGSPEITLDREVTLAAGVYWVAVKANMDFSTGGEWGWNTNNTQRGGPGQWKNGGNGFNTGCTTYQPVLECIASGEGPDFSYSLDQ